MTKTEHYCDHCAGLITESRTVLRVVAGMVSTATEFEFCAECLVAFQSWLAEGRKEKAS